MIFSSDAEICSITKCNLFLIMKVWEICYTFLIVYEENVEKCTQPIYQFI